MRAVPTCRSCGSAHYNFQPCAAALGKTEKPTVSVEWQRREGEHDWHDLNEKEVLGYGGIQWRDDGPKAA